ncbi:hypothetical protein Q3H58_004681 [Pseudomonas psychrotolerans]|nr:hypothetical protein [Pseudomonas psychrotolerans]
MSTIREMLRAEGGALHQQVDATFGHYEIQTRPHYVAFLQAHAQALMGLEALLERSGIQRLLPDWGGAPADGGAGRRSAAPKCHPTGTRSDQADPRRGRVLGRRLRPGGISSGIAPAGSACRRECRRGRARGAWLPRPCSAQGGLATVSGATRSGWKRSGAASGDVGRPAIGLRGFSGGGTAAFADCSGRGRCVLSQATASRGSQ